MFTWLAKHLNLTQPSEVVVDADDLQTVLRYTSLVRERRWRGLNIKTLYDSVFESCYHNMDDLLKQTLSYTTYIENADAVLDSSYSKSLKVINLDNYFVDSLGIPLLVEESILSLTEQILALSDSFEKTKHIVSDAQYNYYTRATKQLCREIRQLFILLLAISD
jgi:hypothetical protein